jgi:hypothetical protein
MALACSPALCAKAEAPTKGACLVGTRFRMSSSCREIVVRSFSASRVTPIS